MKKTLLLLTSIMLLSTFYSCKKDPITPDIKLNAQEISDLTFLREEEKLAHDVYIYAYEKYNDAIFLNISNSEQSHTNSVLGVMKKYSISDPVGNNEVGVFSDNTLQFLYNELTIKVDSSLTHAFEVGAHIEDMDIQDIKDFKSRTSNSDLLDLFNRLSCGSRNHLRSFVGRLDVYTPIYISQKEYNEIINSANEQCGK
jgi:hypothetical protein